jgi:DNA-binding protein H-NS
MLPRSKIRLENPMAKINLQKLDVVSLVNLRGQVEDALSGQRANLEKQLAALGSIGSLGGGGRRLQKVARNGRGGSSLKGRKVAPKYRGPAGELWAGRGATPRWLVAAIKSGKKPESFLIDKSAANGKKFRAKRA